MALMSLASEVHVSDAYRRIDRASDFAFRIGPCLETAIVLIV